MCNCFEMHILIIFPRENKKQTESCRSSDLFRNCYAFPLYQKQWLGSVQFFIYGTYSSGTVQDFHLVPFCIPVASLSEITGNKTQGQIYIFSF